MSFSYDSKSHDSIVAELNSNLDHLLTVRLLIGRTDMICPFSVVFTWNSKYGFMSTFYNVDNSIFKISM